MDATSEINKIFESIFRQHYQRLCSYAFTYLKDKESSEDIVQEVFIKIWENDKIQIGADKLKFYLFTAVRNNCLTRIQKSKKVYFRELKEDDAAEEIKIRLDSVEKNTDPKVLISKAMEQLPPRCREVFMLSRLSGYSYRQITDSLGISVKTVENQMSKAIKVMKTFAKENEIYLLLVHFIIIEKEIRQTVGVFLEKWF
jgi:RNA polymerase sigma-70 factor (ECF subfamily)